MLANAGQAFPDRLQSGPPQRAKEQIACKSVPNASRPRDASPKEEIMFSIRLNGGARVALAAGALLATATFAQAAVLPASAPSYSPSDIQTIDCAVGAHIGPLGACIGGDDRDHHHYHHKCWTNDRGERVCR
jgi:hypothetical protein